MLMFMRVNGSIGRLTVVIAFSVTMPAVGVCFAQGRVDEKASAKTIDAARIDALIEQLGAADYEAREAADAALREIGMPAIEALSQEFLRHDDYERSLRIQRIAEHIYFWDRVLGKNGFLGIQHRAYELSTYYQPNDQRIPADVAAFAIELVIEGTSADRAGLKRGDVIIAVDGNRLPAGATVGQFADQIRGKLPGTEMVFEIWRGDEFKRMPIKIGYRPPNYYYRGQAPADLQAQFDRAVKEFPAWWVPRFGAWKAPTSADALPSRDGFEYLPAKPRERSAGERK